MGGLRFFERVLTHAISGSGLAELQRILRAWFASDLPQFTAIHNERLAEFPFMFEPLITQRNREWVAVAQRLMADDTPTLFVIGSLHTVGPGSFIEQLSLTGIRLTRIAPNVNGRGDR